MGKQAIWISRTNIERISLNTQMYVERGEQKHKVVPWPAQSTFDPLKFKRGQGRAWKETLSASTFR